MRRSRWSSAGRVRPLVAQRPQHRGLRDGVRVVASHRPVLAIPPRWMSQRVLNYRLAGRCWAHRLRPRTLGPMPGSLVGLPAPPRPLGHVEHSTEPRPRHARLGQTKAGLLRTSDVTLTAEALAAAYRQLLAVERGWRNMKGSLGLRPVFHHRQDRVRTCPAVLAALLLIRALENATGDTWRSIRHGLDRMHLVALTTARPR